MCEVIGEFFYLNGEWWTQDYYAKHALGTYRRGRWFWIAGYYRDPDPVSVADYSAPRLPPAPWHDPEKNPVYFGDPASYYTNDPE